MRHVVAVVLLLSSVLVGRPATQTCSCAQSAPPSERRDGGDGKPLYWHSHSRLVTQSQDGPLYCYERKIENDDGGRDVTDVYWPVASFRRDVIGPKDALCDATPVLGIVRQPDLQGPLTYNTGPQPYTTTVRSPGSGWRSTQVSTAVPPAGELASTMQVRVKGRGIATITLTSSVRSTSDGTMLRFDMTNKGPDVRVFWNLPITEVFSRAAFAPNAPPMLSDGKASVRDVRFAGQPTIATVDVHAYDTEMRWIGSSIATAYVAPNGRTQQPINVPPAPLTTN